MNALIEVAFVGSVSLIALILGFGILRAFRARPEGNLEALMAALALGLGLIAYWLFLDGVMGLGVPWAGGGVLGVALGSQGLLDAIAALRKCAQGILTLRGMRLAVASLILPLVLVGLITSLAPPVHNDYDSLTYHLAIPKLYLKARRIYYVPWCDHSNFPFTMEMIYGLGLIISPVAAKLFHYVTFLISLGTIVAIGKSFFSLEAGICGALLFAAVPMTLHEATTGYVDVALAAFSLLAFHFLMSWFSSKSSSPAHEQVLESPQPQPDSLPPQTSESSETVQPVAASLPLCGVCCGLAMGTKYTGVLIFFVCSFIVALQLARTFRARKPSIRPVVLYLVLAIGIASPWYVKNVVHTGNPFFPFLYSVFDGKGWTPEMAHAYDEHQKEFGYDRTLMNLVLSPWRISMWPWNYRFDHPGVHKWCFETAYTPPTMSMIGPALLAFLLPLLIARERAPALKPLIGFAVILFGFWFVQMQYNRYLMPCVALIAVAAGYSAAQLLSRGLLTRAVAFTALALNMAVACILMIDFHLPSIRCGLGLQSREELLAGFRIYRISHEINHRLPQDAKIMLLGEERGFYLDREYIWGNPGHHSLLPYRKMKTGDDWWREMRRLDITHCVINFDQVQNDSAKWISEAVAKGLLSLIHVDGRYGVYALKE